MSIFDGQAIQDIVNKYEARIKDLEQNINKERIEKENVDKAIASSEAIMKNLQNQLDSNEKNLQLLNQSIEFWLTCQTDISKDLLVELTAKKSDWIAEERKSIEELQKNKIVIDTTLRERKSDWENIS